MNRRPQRRMAARAGQRSAVRAGRPLAELLAEAARNGYDLTAQEPLIRHFGDQ